MSTIAIEQATYSRTGHKLPQLLAQSPGLLDAWRAEVEAILVDFGSRPAGWSCPSAVFAQPLGKHHVAVIHLADLNPGDVSADSPVGFHALVIPRQAYRTFIGDPFSVAERFPPDWQARHDLPLLSWPMEAPPRRTVEQVRQVLQRVKGKPLQEDMPAEEQKFHDEENAESPALLGGVQVLVDGGRLFFERRAPDTELLKALWTLLPNNTRSEIWPASFAFSNKLHFDVLVAPPFQVEELEEGSFQYTTEEQAADYPEGRYELHLQIAAESGNQDDLDMLFERRSWNDTWRLAVTLFLAVVILAVASRFMLPPAPPPQQGANLTDIRARQSTMAASVVGMGWPLETITLYRAVREEARKLEEQLK